MALPLTVQFNTHDEADTPVFEQGDNWEDNVVWDYTHSVPQANYQGQRVNFSQPSSSETAILMEIGRINTALYAYPQPSYTASAKSDTDIWNHINRYIWGKSGSQSSPKGNWSADPNAIVPNIQKNTNSIKQMEAKIKSNKVELKSLGDSQNRAKTHRDSIESKVQSHSHNNGWGNPFDLGLGISLTTMAAIGAGAYLLLKKK